MTLRHGRMTQDERAQLRALAAQGKTAMQIAITLQRPLGTITSAIHRGKIPVWFKREFWSPAEDAELIDLVRQGATNPAIAKQLGRPIEGVKGRIAAMGSRAVIRDPSAQAPEPKPRRQPAPPYVGKADPYIAWRQAMTRQAKRPAPASQYA